MATLPERPDLAQLRRQAKELHRAAANGDARAARRLESAHGRVTLSAAQLVVAREHGFTSWPKLRAAVEAAGPTSLPLMADKASKPAVYGAADLLASAHHRGWRPGVIPAGAVFTSQTFITADLEGRPDLYCVSEQLTPANGRVFLTTQGPPVAIACLGLGAPAAVTLLEHLAAMGVRAFIAVGPAPAISNELRRGDCVIIDRALRDDGVSAHYLPLARYAAADPGLTSRLIATAEAHGLHPRSGAAWTVPTPFRTTEEELCAYRAEGVLVTDLVTAAVFAVAAALGGRAASAAVATTPVDVRRPGAPPDRSTARPPGGIARLLEAAVQVIRGEAVAP